MREHALTLDPEDGGKIYVRNIVNTAQRAEPASRYLRRERPRKYLDLRKTN
jgi:hypothetical protein